MALEPKQLLILGIVGGVALLSIILVSISVKKLSSDEVAVKYDTIWKSLADQASYEGLHLGSPGFQFIVFPSVFRTLEYGNLQCLNEDGVEIYLGVSFQYRLRGKDLKDIILQFKDHDGYKEVLTAIGSSAIHDACSQYNTSQFQSERGQFQETLKTRLVQKFDDVSCDVTDLQVNDILRPREYEQAINAKEAAREDIEVAKQERPKELTAAETKKREAETQASITLSKALSDARVIENRANSEAEAITNDFDKESETYNNIVNAPLNLGQEGFMQYMGMRAIEDSENTVFIGMDSPAKTNYVKP